MMDKFNIQNLFIDDEGNLVSESSPRENRPPTRTPSPSSVTSYRSASYWSPRDSSDLTEEADIQNMTIKDEGNFVSKTSIPSATPFLFHPSPQNDPPRRHIDPSFHSENPFLPRIPPLARSPPRQNNTPSFASPHGPTSSEPFQLPTTTPNAAPFLPYIRTPNPPPLRHITQPFPSARRPSARRLLLPPITSPLPRRSTAAQSPLKNLNFFERPKDRRRNRWNRCQETSSNPKLESPQFLHSPSQYSTLPPILNPTHFPLPSSPPPSPVPRPLPRRLPPPLSTRKMIPASYPGTEPPSPIDSKFPTNISHRLLWRSLLKNFGFMVLCVMVGVVLALMYMNETWVDEGEGRVYYL